MNIAFFCNVLMIKSILPRGGALWVTLSMHPDYRNMVHYNTHEDVEKLISVLKKI